MRRGREVTEGSLRKRSLIREVNERMRELNGSWGMSAARFHVLCECTRPECSQRIEVPLDVYEGVRIEADRFVVAPDHEHGPIERVVAEDTAYRVVRTRPGFRWAGAAPVSATPVPAS